MLVLLLMRVEIWFDCMVVSVCRVVVSTSRVCVHVYMLIFMIEPSLSPFVNSAGGRVFWVYEYMIIVVVNVGEVLMIVGLADN